MGCLGNAELLMLLHNFSGRLKCGPAARSSGVKSLIIEWLTVLKVELYTVHIAGKVLARGDHFLQGRMYRGPPFPWSNFCMTGPDVGEKQLWTLCCHMLFHTLHLPHS